MNTKAKRITETLAQTRRLHAEAVSLDSRAGAALRKLAGSVGENPGSEGGGLLQALQARLISEAVEGSPEMTETLRTGLREYYALAAEAQHLRDVASDLAYRVRRELNIPTDMEKNDVELLEEKLLEELLK